MAEQIQENDDIPTFHSEKIDGFSSLESGTGMIYHSLYDRIFWDIDQAHKCLNGRNETNYADLIHASAHLRLALEAIVSASFAGSHKLFSDAQRKISAAKNWDQMRKNVRQINPKYWPVAFGIVEHDGVTGRGVKPHAGLQEGEVGYYYGILSEVLHAHNPFRKNKRKPEEVLTHLQDLIRKLHELLDWHIMQMADSPEYVYLFRDKLGEIKVTLFTTTTPLL